MKNSRTLKSVLLLVIMASSLLLVGWQNPPSTVTLTTDDGLIITLDVPDGWIREVDEAGDQIYVGTTPEAVDLARANSVDETAATPINGTAGALTGVSNEVLPVLIEAGQELNAANIFAAFAASADGSTVSTVSESSAVVVSGFTSAARGSLVIGDNVGMLYVLHNANGAILAIVLGSDVADFEAILATVTLHTVDAPAPVTQTATLNSSAGLTVSLDIPADWQFEAIAEEELLWVGTDATAISTANETDIDQGIVPTVDGQVIGISPLSSDVIAYLIPSTTTPTATEVLEYLASESENATFSSVEPFPVLGYTDGASVAVLAGDITINYYILFSENGVLLVATFGLDKDTLADLVAGIRLQPTNGNGGTDVEAVSRNPNLPEVYVLRSNGTVISFAYPTDWQTEVDEEAGEVYIVTDENVNEAFDAFGDDGFDAFADPIEGSGINVAGVPVSDYEGFFDDGVTAENLMTLLEELGTEVEGFEWGESEEFLVETFTGGVVRPYTIGANSGAIYVLVDDEAAIFILAVGPDIELIDQMVQSMVASTESPSE